MHRLVISVGAEGATCLTWPTGTVLWHAVPRVNVISNRERGGGEEVAGAAGVRGPSVC